MSSDDHSTISSAKSLHLQIRTIAFQYLIDHIETQYSDYDPTEPRRFIPAFSGSEPCLASVKEVRYSFSNAVKNSNIDVRSIHIPSGHPWVS